MKNKYKINIAIHRGLNLIDTSNGSCIRINGKIYYLKYGESQISHVHISVINKRQNEKMTEKADRKIKGHDNVCKSNSK